MQSTPDPTKYPVAFAVGAWAALSVLLIASGVAIPAAVVGAVSGLIPFVVIGVRWALGKSTAVK